MRVVLPLIVCVSIVTVMAISPQVLVQHDALAQQGNVPPPDPNCQPFGNAVPAGVQQPVPAGEPDRPIWCYPLSAPTQTYVEGANDWVDNYDNNGPALQTTHPDYNVWRITSNDRIAVGAFVNDDHWDFDMGDASQYRLSGGALLSPGRSFHFENGKFVYEGDIAAGSAALGGADAFSEMDMSPASSPTGIVTDELYGYGEFGGVGAMGCRFERDADGPHIICAMYDNTGRTVGQGGRVWETQGAGTGYTASSVQGGYPQWPIPGTNLHVSDVWRMCPDNGAYDSCLDRFRMEVTKDSIHILVNGYTVMLIDGLYAVNPHTGADNRIPDSWLGSSGVYAYYTSWINGGIHHATRFYWDRVAVNPHSGSGFAAPSASPTFCLGQPNNTCPEGSTPPTSTPPPSNTPTRTATPTPQESASTATAVPGATSTSLPVATNTPLSIPTNTPAPTSTRTPTPQPTNTRTPTPVPTNTPLPTSTPVPTPTRTPTPVLAGPRTVTFDDLSNPNRPLSGQYPTGLIDWGSGAWWLAGPTGRFTTNSISFNGAGPLNASFTFIGAHKLTQLDAYNADALPSTVTITCVGQAPVTAVVGGGQTATIRTNWIANCASVTIASTNGWLTNFDNLVVN